MFDDGCMVLAYRIACLSEVVARRRLSVSAMHMQRQAEAAQSYMSKQLEAARCPGGCQVLQDSGQVLCEQEPSQCQVICIVRLQLICVVALRSTGIGLHSDAGSAIACIGGLWPPQNHHVRDASSCQRAAASMGAVSKHLWIETRSIEHFNPFWLLRVGCMEWTSRAGLVSLLAAQPELRHLALSTRRRCLQPDTCPTLQSYGCPGRLCVRY